MPNPTPFCAQLSYDNGDPLHGSASTATVWLLLEYSGPWREKAIKDNDLPPDANNWLRENLANIAHSRALFIKRERSTAGPIAFYLCRAEAERQQLWRWHVADYAALGRINLEAVLDGTVAGPVSAEKLTLVCTNGKRDRCCSKFGLPVYNALRAAGDDHVWQCTHLGGHRFAATCALLPEGAYYGYIQPSQATGLTAARQADELDLSLFRGRTFYKPAVQAADYFVRQQARQTEFDGVALRSSATVNTTTAAIFTVGQQTYRAVVRETLLGTVLVGCSHGKSKPQTYFKLLSLDEV